MKKLFVAALVVCVCALASSVNAQDGYFVCEKGGNLETKKAYSDFIFRFEFKLPKNGNNGVGIRTTAANLDAAYNGMEIQIIDENYPNLAEWQRHGSIYGVVPAKTGALKPVGEWNYEEIVAIGPQIKVTVNGQVIVDADITNAKPIHEAEHPGLHNKSGFIGFLGHGDPVEFRNVRILSLAKDDAPVADAQAPAANAGKITLEQAKQIALKHAKLTADAVTFTKVGEEIDDGIHKYEVEFYKDNVEYDYDIDVNTGAILSFDQDAESFTPAAQPQAAGNGITRDQALQIALKHAKVAQSAISRTQIKRDRDDGRDVYEVEFHVGRTEYNFDIDAKTGAVLEYDVDNDD